VAATNQRRPGRKYRAWKACNNVRYSISIDDKTYDVEISEVEGRWHCRLNGRDIQADFIQLNASSASVLLNGKSYQVRRDTSRAISIGDRHYEVAVEDPRSWQGRRRKELLQAGLQRLASSMPGKVVRVLSREGDTVEAGQGIVVVEAMKMQNEIKSARAGTLRKLLVREGANVSAGEVLAIVE
jgi:biotin carboxyl carrier protein